MDKNSRYLRNMLRYDDKPKLLRVQERKRSFDFTVVDTQSPNVGPQKICQ